MCCSPGTGASLPVRGTATPAGDPQPVPAPPGSEGWLKPAFSSSGREKMVVGQPRGAQEGEDFLKQQEEQHLGRCAAGWRPAQPECVGQRYREPFAGLRAARKRKVFSLPASRRQTALVLHKKVQLQPTLGGHINPPGA